MSITKRTTKLLSAQTSVSPLDSSDRSVLFCSRANAYFDSSSDQISGYSFFSVLFPGPIKFVQTNFDSLRSLLYEATATSKIQPIYRELLFTEQARERDRGQGQSPRDNATPTEQLSSAVPVSNDPSTWREARHSSATTSATAENRSGSESPEQGCTRYLSGGRENQSLEAAGLCDAAESAEPKAGPGGSGAAKNYAASSAAKNRAAARTNDMDPRGRGIAACISSPNRSQRCSAKSCAETETAAAPSVAESGSTCSKKSNELWAAEVAVAKFKERGGRVRCAQTYHTNTDGIPTCQSPADIVQESSEMYANYLCNGPKEG